MSNTLNMNQQYIKLNVVSFQHHLIFQYFLTERNRLRRDDHF